MTTRPTRLAVTGLPSTSTMHYQLAVSSGFLHHHQAAGATTHHYSWAGPPLPGTVTDLPWTMSWQYHFEPYHFAPSTVCCWPHVPCLLPLASEEVHLFHSQCTTALDPISYRFLRPQRLENIPSSTDLNCRAVLSCPSSSFSSVLFQMPLHYIPVSLAFHGASSLQLWNAATSPSFHPILEHFDQFHMSTFHPGHASPLLEPCQLL